MELPIFRPFLSFKYRDRAKIIADILSSLVVRPEGKRKTNIMQSANLSSDLLNKYLDLLLRNGYIMVEGSSIYKLTPRGLRLLQNLDIEYLRISMRT